jgi:hypothetical protein
MVGGFLCGKWDSALIFIVPPLAGWQGNTIRRGVLATRESCDTLHTVAKVVPQAPKGDGPFGPGSNGGGSAAVFGRRLAVSSA